MIDWNKSIEFIDTNDRVYPARYIGKLNNTTILPYIVEVTGCKDEELVRTDSKGACRNPAFRVRNVPPKTGSIWVNIYPTAPFSSSHVTPQAAASANDLTGTKRIACIEVPWTEGEGIEEDCPF